jgi:hypothetical protein
MPLGETSLTASLNSSWRANSDGKKTRIPLGELRGMIELPMDVIVLMYPFQTDIDFKVIRAAGRNALSNFRKVLAPSTGTGPLGASLLKNR